MPLGSPPPITLNSKSPCLSLAAAVTAPAPARIPHSMFGPIAAEDLSPNMLVFNVQPDEGISLTIQAKHPGPKLCMSCLSMNFNYNQIFGEEPPEAYERLLLDAVSGDSTLFTRTDTIEELWRICDPVLASWQLPEAPPPALYAAGEWGPAEADHLIEADGRHWHRM